MSVDRAVWPNAPARLRCRCGELDVEHAIRANGTRGACSVSRGACSVSRGPKAVPCGCREFAPEGES